MKKSILIFLTVIYLFFPSLALADVSVNVSNNSNVIQQSSSKTTTDIKIETNGEVKSFHTEGNETVNWTSDDGKSHVSVNNQNVSNSNNTQNSTTNIHTTINAAVNTGNATPSSNPKLDLDLNKIMEKKTDLFAFIRQELNLLNNFISNFFKK